MMAAKGCSSRGIGIASVAGVRESRVGTFRICDASKIRAAAKVIMAVAPARCPLSHSAAVRCDASTSSGGGDSLVNRRATLGVGASLGAASLLNLEFPNPALANKPVSSKWEQVDLPVDSEVVLLDIGFSGNDRNHGFLLGTRQTLLETKDGGKTWTQKSIQSALDEGFNYRFQSISFNGDEGWIVGKPPLVLHSTDGGNNWERIPLSSKLPGSPLLITALPGEKGQAEMTTDQGAIYVTNNAGFTWQAAVQETVDATLNRTVSSGITGASYYEGYFANVSRSPETGSYVAVSSRGNFYMTWKPGDTFWMPHNRPVGRRVQNMGWTGKDKLWLTTRGGDVFLSPDSGISEKFDEAQFGSRGFGILDVGFRDENEGYACGGSGSLFSTADGGITWKRDRSADDIPGNLYSVKFSSRDIGFILGNSAILLKYIA